LSGEGETKLERVKKEKGKWPNNNEDNAGETVHARRRREKKGQEEKGEEEKKKRELVHVGSPCTPSGDMWGTNTHHHSVTCHYDMSPMGDVFTNTSPIGVTCSINTSPIGDV
jgi:hypothetical protein